MELQKHLGASVQNYVIAARTAQGYEDWRVSTEEERLSVVSHWHAAQIEPGKNKMQWQGRRLSTPQELPITGRITSQQRKQVAQGKSKVLTGVEDHDDKANSQKTSRPAASAPNRTSFEEAIRQSVEATSTGDTEEDRIIESAIRASIAELQKAPTEDSDSEALGRAIQASHLQAKQTRSHQTPSPSKVPTTTTEHDEDLERALRTSMQNYESPNDNEELYIYHDRDDSGVDTDDDKNIKRALENSRLPADSPPAYYDDDLQTALDISEQDRQNREDRKAVAISEEEIVLEYVKKQSLAEAAHRQAMTQTREPDG